MKSLPLARLVMYAGVAWIVLLSSYLVEGLKSSPLISICLHLLHNCPSSRQVGYQIFGFLLFQLHLPHQFFGWLTTNMLFLYSRFIVDSLSLSFSPQLMRRGAEIPEIAFQMISCFVKSKYVKATKIFYLFHFFTLIFNNLLLQFQCHQCFLMHSLCLPACPSPSVSVR